MTLILLEGDGLLTPLLPLESNPVLLQRQAEIQHSHTSYLEISGGEPASGTFKVSVNC